jgi:integrase
VKIGKNLKDAQRQLVQIQARVDLEAFEVPVTKRFDEWASEWLAGLELAVGTLQPYRATMKHAAAFFGTRKVGQITKADIIAFNKHMRDELKLKPSTRHKHISTLSTAFEAAKGHGYATKNPVAELPRASKPKKERKEAAYFENEELRQLFAAIDEPLLFTVARLAVLTGMRIGEVVALRWSDVDLATRTIRVRRTLSNGVLGVPKSKSARTVDLLDDAVALLKQWRSAVGNPPLNEYLFDAVGERPARNQALYRDLYQAMERAGIPRKGPTDQDRSFHAFRHTFAKICLEGGAAITWVQRQLGHSTIVITVDTYGHWEHAARVRHREIAGVAMAQVWPQDPQGSAPVIPAAV